MRSGPSAASPSCFAVSCYRCSASARESALKPSASRGDGFVPCMSSVNPCQNKALAFSHLLGSLEEENGAAYLPVSGCSAFFWR